MKPIDSKTNKNPVLSKIGYVAFLNLGILMMSVGIYFFKAPNGFATGGVSGISILLAKIFSALNINLSQGAIMLVINVLLLIAGVIILGKEVGFKTIYCSITMSLENWLLEYIVPMDTPLTPYPLLELVYAVLLTGIGAAIIFRCKASSGGTDIVALILKKYTSLNVGEALLVSDFVIAASTFFIYGIQAGLFSILGLFAKVFIVDDILDSMNMCKAFTIITTKPDEINTFIITEMHHSATAHRGEGIYSHSERHIIITVCKRTEALKLRRAIKQIDPGSFIIITKTSEIMGKGFRDI